MIGVAASEWTLDELAEFARSAVEDSGRGVDPDVFGRLVSLLDYVAGDYRNRSTSHPMVERYQLGTWGPGSADRLLPYGVD